MNNTLAILSYLIFNNILEDFFLNQRILKNKVTIKKASVFTQDKLNDIKGRNKGWVGLLLDFVF